MTLDEVVAAVLDVTASDMAALVVAAPREAGASAGVPSGRHVERVSSERPLTLAQKRFALLLGPRRSTPVQATAMSRAAVTAAVLPGFSTARVYRLVRMT